MEWIMISLGDEFKQKYLFRFVCEFCFERFVPKKIEKRQNQKNEKKKKMLMLVLQ